MEFYYCNECGNLVIKIEDGGMTPSCCGSTMIKLTANQSNPVENEHLPIYQSNSTDDMLQHVTVQIGRAPHTMSSIHHIKWVLLDTDTGFQLKYLDALEDPLVTFHMNSSETVLRIYSYCNLHGLWQRDLFI